MDLPQPRKYAEWHPVLQNMLIYSPHAYNYLIIFIREESQHYNLDELPDPEVESMKQREIRLAILADLMEGVCCELLRVYDTRVVPQIALYSVFHLGIESENETVLMKTRIPTVKELLEHMFMKMRIYNEDSYHMFIGIDSNDHKDYFIGCIRPEVKTMDEAGRSNDVEE